MLCGFNKGVTRTHGGRGEKKNGKKRRRREGWSRWRRRIEREKGRLVRKEKPKEERAGKGEKNF